MFPGLSGTAEAVPYPKPICETNSSGVFNYVFPEEAVLSVA